MYIHHIYSFLYSAINEKQYKLCLFLQMITSYQLGGNNSLVTSEIPENNDRTVIQKMFNIVKKYLFLNQISCQQFILSQTLTQ